LVASPFQPIERKSVADAIYEQLRDRILREELPAGSVLPGEMTLARELGVSRAAVREAIKRLEGARLIALRHGGAKRVLDYRQSAGLELLPELLAAAGSDLDPALVRGVMEMRSALAPDIAQLAAQRAGETELGTLDRAVAAMVEGTPDLARLQALALDFWDALVRASGNLAYRLAFNSLRETYWRSRELLREPLARELHAHGRYAALVRTLRRGDGERAARHARAITRLGEEGVLAALAQRSEEEPE
jgi:GntR family transcriptional repressor for pyruvate dehydrogenase complex